MPDYAPGTPSWVELSTPDADASAAFYGELMGWNAAETGTVEETGGYRMFQQEGQSVGGLMGHMQPGQPTFWATYISVDDADAIAEQVASAGGGVIVEPMDVMDIGRMAFFTDPGGFDWHAGKPGFEGAPGDYTVWELGDKQVGGMMPLRDDFFGPEVPSHWSVCFAVADVDATVAKARELGATVTMEPMDMAIGRFAGLVDPQGASFTIMQFTR